MRRLGGLAPIELTVDNQYVALQYLMAQSKKRKAYDLGIEIGSRVRIMLSNRFGSGNTQRFSTEIFTVSDKLDTYHPVMFRLVDSAGQVLSQIW